MSTQAYTHGNIVLLGSGETLPSSGKIHEWVARSLGEPPHIAIMETPAGFEPNSDKVAEKIATFLERRLQNYNPTTRVIPARKRGTPFSPDKHEIVQPILEANWILLGPGSPSYGARQLRQSLAVEMINARHQMGATLFLSSSATLAFGKYTVPVYEIYKVGEDVHWKDGVDYFSRFGLPLTIVPHWNNTDGGDDLDTSHCYMGQARFDQLRAQLPADQTILGLDEHTAVVIDLAADECHVVGNGRIYILFGDQLESEAKIFQSGDTFAPSEIGPWCLPNPGGGLPAAVWEEAQAVQARLEAEANAVPEPPAEVRRLANQRASARANREWQAADQLRDRITNLGWEVRDTPEGAELVPLS